MHDHMTERILSKFNLQNLTKHLLSRRVKKIEIIAMISFKSIKTFLNFAPKVVTPQLMQCAGLKEFAPPRDHGNIEYPTRPKLRIIEKVPNYFNNIRPPKMQKRLKLMRGPELVHTTLQHRQYGIIAEGGGRLKHPHYEMARLSIGRKLDTTRMFAIWRIPAPWQPLTKKGIGVRMGSGKGAINHYATPIRAGRVILEIAGNCEFEEVRAVLEHVAVNLPFKARAVSQEMMEEMAAEKEAKKKANLNPFTAQYVIQNNLSGCHRWLSPNDHKYFGEYL